MLSRRNMAAVVAEIIGTGLLTTVILGVSRSPIGLPYFTAIAAGLTMAVMVLAVGSTSGAHINPAVTIGMWSLRKTSTIRAIAYMVAQFMGAALAWRLYTYMIDSPVKSIANKTFDWRVFVAEVVGTFIFTFGIAAAVYQAQDLGRKAATIGGSLLLGILVASAASNGLLNPAVALGVQSWSTAYVLGPVLGAIVGMNLYALLFADTSALAATVASVRTTSRKAPVKKKTAARKR